MKRWLLVIVLAALPVAAPLAQEQDVPAMEETEEVYEDEMSDFEYYTWEMISSIIPFMVFAVLIFFILRRVKKRNQPYIQRSQEHMDRMEEKYDRVIDLLERLIESKGSNSGQNE